MRIVVFSRHFAEYSFRYANALARDADVLLIVDGANASKQWDIDCIERNAHLSVRYFDLRIRQGFGIFEILYACILAVRFRPNFVYFHEIPDPISPLLMLLLAAFSKIALIVHDPSPHSGRDSTLPFWLFRLRDLGRSVADLIFLHGEYCRNSFVESNPRYRSKVRIINHGILMSEGAVSIERNPLRMLFFGRMEGYKGVDTALAAVRLLVSRNIKFELVVAGRGAELDNYREELLSVPGVQVRSSYITPSEAKDLFGSASFVLLPYKDATQSGVVASAFGNGRPVIASRVGGLPDVVKHEINGLLVEPGDAIALADAMARLLADPVLVSQLSNGAVRSANNELAWSSIADVAMQHLRAAAR